MSLAPPQPPTSGGVPDHPDALLDRLHAVRARIDDACGRAGRSRSAVTLVAVTKLHPVGTVEAVIDAGVSDIGENRVQELVTKMARLRAGGRSARWHLLGRLQRNKVRTVVGSGVLVHSVDRLSLVDELSRRALTAGVVQRVLIQVNVDGDAAKGGCPVEDALDLVGAARDRPALSVEGLMTLPAAASSADAAAARAVFARLRGLRDAARERWPEVAHLSMGMSADFEVAVEEGATIVRLGTVLVGARPGQAYGSPRGQEDR